jgi:hypothetical protein
VLALLLFTGCYDFSYQDLPAISPVATARLTRCNGRPHELSVSLERGFRIDSLVDLSYFDGLDHRTSEEEALRRFGNPRGVRTQPEMGLKVALYPVAKGEVGFMTVPSHSGPQSQVWAYPVDHSPAAVILDPSLRAQLLSHLPTNGLVRVHIFRNVGYGSITLGMNSTRVDYLILGPRDGQE